MRNRFASVAGVCLLLAGCPDAEEPTAEEMAATTDQDHDGVPVVIDCDDANSSTFPGAAEVCDRVDNDCDGLVDEDGAFGQPWYADNDGDGFGHTTPVMACSAPTGFVANSDDCDDDLATVSPDGTETCNGLDDDCDGTVDEADAAGAPTWYADADADGFGDPDMGEVGCTAPVGYAADGSDCDDADATVTGPTVWYADADEDGFGLSSQSVSSCDEPAGSAPTDTGLDTADSGDTAAPVVASAWSTVSGDCDDARSDVYVAADEVCDDADNDCNGLVDEDPVYWETWFADVDGDGYGGTLTAIACEAPEGFVEIAGEADCNDVDPTSHPGAKEMCDERDNDCDGSVDEVAKDAYTFYVDLDGDGFGTPSETLDDCKLPDGFSWTDDDCDDLVATSYPDADEWCNGADDDCDGETDEHSSLDAGTWYLDQDGDGFGDPDEDVVACAAPLAYISGAGDCDDANADASPEHTELCNGFDDDCDGDVDNEAADFVSYFFDLDRDGFGDASTEWRDCPGLIPAMGDTAAMPGDTSIDSPADSGADTAFDTDTLVETPWGVVDNGDDCRDLDPVSHPGALEYCDGLDNDCDGRVDESSEVQDPLTWYRDADSDGFGDPAVPTEACTQPVGYVINPGDCDDTENTTSPNKLWWVDLDGDGYGNYAFTLQSCVGPVGWIDNADDCDDTTDDRKPGADEWCDDLDNDCDEVVDEIEEVLDPTTFWADVDGDGYGDATYPLDACFQPDGYVQNDLDCLDGEGQEAINPDTLWYHDEDQDSYGDESDTMTQCDEPEAGPGEAWVLVGGDCDDDDVLVTPNTVWYLDADADGHGNAAVTWTGCSPPDGYVRFDADADCDDLEPLAWADRVETCDGIDNDCKNGVDDGVTTTFYDDWDGDGRGDPNDAAAACSAPPNHVLVAGDCDDGDPLAWTGNPEVCDGADNDCINGVDDGVLNTYYDDGDGDLHGDPLDATDACTAPMGTVANATDCNDAEPAAWTGRVETCDGVDNDCANGVDDGVTTRYYDDGDGDGRGDPNEFTNACAAPIGTVANSNDCNDAEPLAWTGRVETCDLVDNDCSGVVDNGVTTTYYRDADGDGQGAALSTTAACSLPAGYVANTNDCNDSEAQAWTGRAEVCDGIDNDCVGGVDNGVTTTFYRDVDGDGRGTATTTTAACNLPNGYSFNSNDCNDGEAEAWTGRAETCDGIDNDCANGVDDGVLITWYDDADGDGYGDAADPQGACVAPANHVIDATDCDDADADVLGPRTWYQDVDLDGSAGGVNRISACAQPADHYSFFDDCDDADNTVRPGAPEICDGLDNDCDLLVDDGSFLGQSDTCPGQDCLQIHNYTGSITTGLYWIDPEGTGAYRAYCEMETDGGGWTLVATNTHSGWWTADPNRIRNTTTTGSPSLTALYKGRTFNEVLFADLMFEDDDGDYAVYSGVSDYSTDYQAFSATLGDHNCATATWPMTVGNLAVGGGVGRLCDTNLYIHPYDFDGGSCGNDDNADGPAWSARNNNGCPLDDVEVFSYIDPSFFNGGTPNFDSNATLRMWVR